MHQQSFSITHNPEKSRFETSIAGLTAVVDYIRMGKKIIYTHTEVPETLEGSGIGSALAQHVLDFARENELQVMPLCPFIASYIRKHPEYRDLVIAGFAL